MQKVSRWNYFLKIISMSSISFKFCCGLMIFFDIELERTYYLIGYESKWVLLRFLFVVYKSPFKTFSKNFTLDHDGNWHFCFEMFLSFPYSDAEGSTSSRRTIHETVPHSRSNVPHSRNKSISGNLWVIEKETLSITSKTISPQANYAADIPRYIVKQTWGS